MEMDVNDPQFMPLYNDMEASLERAWQASLKLIGCVECARLDMAQRVRMWAANKSSEIIGEDWANENALNYEAEWPTEKDGLRRVCENCMTAPPPGSIRFFKHGTDEFIATEDREKKFKRPKRTILNKISVGYNPNTPEVIKEVDEKLRPKGRLLARLPMTEVTVSMPEALLPLAEFAAKNQGKSAGLFMSTLLSEALYEALAIMRRQAEKWPYDG